MKNNIHLQMAMLVAMGMLRPEQKDTTNEVTAALAEIKSGLLKIGERLTAVEGGQVQLKSLDAKAMADDAAAMKADLAELKKAIHGLPEFKSLDDKFASFKTQLDETERKINRAVVDSMPKNGRGRVDRKSWDKLTDAMKAGQDIEVKSLDSDLKVQDIFADTQLVMDYPLLGRVFRRPTRSDAPRYSYYTGSTVIVKGSEESQTQGERVKVLLSTKTYEYKPAIASEDVEDAGAAVLQDEMDAGSEATMERLNADVVNALEAAALAKASVNDETKRRTKVALIETATAAAIDNDDLDALIAELPRKFRRNAVFMANPVMTATLKGIKDEQDRSMWAPSLEQGTPAKLKGYDFIEDDNLADDVVVFCNPARCLAVMDRQAFMLYVVNRSGSDYAPVYNARFASGLTNARAAKILQIKAGEGS